MLLGNYDQVINILSKQYLKDDAGESTERHKLEKQTFARVEQIGQRKNLNDLNQQLPTAFRVAIHYDSFNITTKNVIDWNGDIYNVITTPTRNKVRNCQEWIFDISRSDND